MSKKYIVFDLDDTLYYEIDYLKSAYQEIATSVSEKDSPSIYAQMLDLYTQKKDVFEFLSLKYDLDKASLLKTYREHFPHITLRNGVKQVLEFLKTQNVKMGLLTDGRSQTQRNKIKALDIEHYFDKIIISEEIGTEKPHPQNYKAFIDTAESYFYIADNPNKDFITPNLLGWHTIMIEDEQQQKIHACKENLTPDYKAQKKSTWEGLFKLIN